MHRRSMNLSMAVHVAHAIIVEMNASNDGIAHRFSISNHVQWNFGGRAKCTNDELR